MKADAIDALRYRLNAAIQQWFDDECESDAWEACQAYMGENAVSLMTDAAIAVFKGIVDVQDYLRAEGDIK